LSVSDASKPVLCAQFWVPSLSPPNSWIRSFDFHLSTRPATPSLPAHFFQIPSHSFRRRLFAAFIPPYTSYLPDFSFYRSNTLILRYIERSHLLRPRCLPIGFPPPTTPPPLQATCTERTPLTPPLFTAPSVIRPTALSIRRKDIPGLSPYPASRQQVCFPVP